MVAGSKGCLRSTRRKTSHSEMNQRSLNGQSTWTPRGLLVSAPIQSSSTCDPHATPHSAASHQASLEDAVTFPVTTLARIVMSTIEPRL